MGNLGDYLNTTKGVTLAASLGIILCALYMILFRLKLRPGKLFIDTIKKISRKTGKFINGREKKYHRDLEIGRINSKSRRSKLYKFLNDLTIDLGLKKRGITPYEFLLFGCIGSLFISLIVGFIVFNNAIMSILAYPAITFGLFCILYTKANMAHDLRIESVIDAENIICNSIKSGVVVAVKQSIDSMPVSVQDTFRNFLDNVEYNNFHIKTALLDLNNNLGSIADDFILKCITLELEEEEGLVGIFKDVVEINNIKSAQRTKMKRSFEQVMTEFLMGLGMIMLFLFGAIAIYPTLQHFYFRTTIGQLLMVADLTLVVIEFMYITMLRAKEL